ncbi:MAG: hypothetical protein ACJA00_000896, partial [Myxococcota bacterium]
MPGFAVAAPLSTMRSRQGLLFAFDRASPLIAPERGGDIVVLAEDGLAFRGGRFGGLRRVSHCVEIAADRR